MSGDNVQHAIDEALAGRQYVFAVHGRPKHQARRRTRSRGARRGPYAVEHPSQFDLQQFSHADNLMAAFRILRAGGGHAPGIDGLTYENFSPGQIWQTLRVVASALRDGTYAPYDTRLVRTPRGDGRYRELNLPTVSDRTVAKALQLAMAPYWVSILPGLRRSVWQIYAAMDQHIRTYHTYVLTTDDIRDCFPSIQLVDALGAHRLYAPQPDLTRLVDIIVRGQDDPNRTAVGLDQGSPYSPLLSELTLHTYLDKTLDDVWPGHPPVYRYVDNIPILTTGAHEGLQMLETIQRILEPHQLTLKGIDGDPVDLRNSDHGRMVLGLVPVFRGERLTFQVPTKAYQKLEMGLEKTLLLPNPSQVANHVVEGWLTALGPAFVNADTRDILRRTMEISTGYGLRELSLSRLRTVVNKAKVLWLAVRRDVARTRQGGLA